MTRPTADRILGECAFLGSAPDDGSTPEDPELRALRTAIVIEDVFGVTLTEEQLGSDLLADPAALRDLLDCAASVS